LGFKGMKKTWMQDAGCGMRDAGCRIAG